MATRSLGAESVPLTTVAPPGYEIGRKGVQLLMEQIENKAPAKTKHIRVGSAARTVTAVTAAEDINRQELVRPFLLERASTPGKHPDRRHGHQPRCVSIARP